jgi:hypothetical protein
VDKIINATDKKHINIVITMHAGKDFMLERINSDIYCNSQKCLVWIEFILKFNYTKNEKNSKIIGMKIIFPFAIESILISIKVGFHSNSKFSSFVNIYKIDFVESLNAFGILTLNNDIISNAQENNFSARIPINEIKPTLYIVAIKNTSSLVELVLKQNFNPNRRIAGIPSNLTEHVVANYIENGFGINRTGNYTFYIIFISQKTNNEINTMALSVNSVAAILIAISILRRGSIYE